MSWIVSALLEALALGVLAAFLSLAMTTGTDLSALGYVLVLTLFAAVLAGSHSFTMSLWHASKERTADNSDAMARWRRRTWGAAIASGALMATIIAATFLDLMAKPS